MNATAVPAASFSGERLQLARQARGLTIRALAGLSGLHANSIGAYEKGASVPKAESIIALAHSLNVLPSYLTGRKSAASSAPVFYRSLAATTATDRTYAYGRFRWTAEIVHWAEQFVDFPSTQIPDLVGDGDVLSLPDRRIDDLAGELRRAWGLGTGVVENMVWLLESHGVMITRGEGGSKAIDAFTQWDAANVRPHMFLCDEKGSAFRSRLDAAHELGHLVLHRGVTHEMQRDPRVFKRLEQQAFRFGASFLLPVELFTDYVPSLSLETLLTVKPALKASVKSLIYRGVELGYVSTDYAQHLWRAYARRGWQQGEPGDDTVPLEQPALLRSALEYIVDEGLQSRSEVVTALGIPAGDIETLCGLSPGYLAAMKPMIRPAAPGLTPSHSPQTAGAGRVIAFPGPRE